MVQILSFRVDPFSEAPVLVDPFSEGDWCALKQIGIRKRCLPWLKWRKIY